MPGGGMLAVCVLLALLGVWFYAAQVARISASAAPVPDTFGYVELVVAGLLIAMFVHGTLSSWGKQAAVTPRILIMGILMYASLVILLLGILVARNLNPLRVFGLDWPGWRKGLGFVLIALIACFPILLVVERVSFEIAGPGAKPQEILTFLVDHHGLRDRVLLLSLAIIVSPVAEEMIFRGFIYGVLRQYAGRVAGVVVTSALFAFIHGHLPSLGSLFLLAVALSIVYERTGSLWASISMHAGFNTLNAILAIGWPSLS